MLLAFILAGFGPSATETPELLAQIFAAGIVTALLYAALSMAVSSFTTRRAAAAVGVVLLLFVPASIVRAAIESADAPKELDLLSSPFVVFELAYRIFGETGDSADPVATLSTWLVAGGVGRRHPGRRARLLAPLSPARGVPVSEPRVVAENVSKWFGALVAVSDVSFDVGPGVTALLGPNGAGKSTMFRMLCGLARPSKGTVRVLGRDPRADTGVTRLIGLVPQQESVFEPLTAREFVTLSARLQGLTDPGGAATAALETVDLDPTDSRRLPAYSKGMRQRVKVAQAIVHDPAVLVLDEPLTGLDPRQRMDLVALFRRLGSEGRCVIVSSHVLGEVERLGSQVLVMSQGRLAAAGDFHDLRALMDDRPMRIRVRTDRPRELGGALLEAGTAVGVRLDGDEVLELDTRDARALAHALAPVARERGARLYEVHPLDADLEGVFRYVVER